MTNCVCLIVFRSTIKLTAMSPGLLHLICFTVLENINNPKVIKLTAF